MAMLNNQGVNGIPQLKNLEGFINPGLTLGIW